MRRRKSESGKAADQFPEAGPVSGGKKKILIIDDDQDVLFVITKILDEMGYDTISASTGAEGILLLKFKPVLIFLDLNLPDGPGFDLVDIIRSSSPDAYIAVLTAYSGLAELDRAAEEDVDEFITKPVNPKTIRQIIEVLLY